MGNTLSERIAKNQLEKCASDHSRNKVAFLALKDDIATALVDGWSQKAIWETLFVENKISFSYKTFCVYISRFISHTSHTQEKFREDKQEKNQSKTEIRGFVFNPKPNLKELL